MAIKINPQPIEVKAELPGYGIFYLRRLGAAPEAEIRARADKLRADISPTEADKKIGEQELELIKAGDAEKLAKFRASTPYKESLERKNNGNKKLAEFLQYCNRQHLKLWRAEDPQAMKRMLNDFTMDQIKGFYAQVMEQAEKEDV